MLRLKEAFPGENKKKISLRKERKKYKSESVDCASGSIKKYADSNHQSIFLMDPVIINQYPLLATEVQVDSSPCGAQQSGLDID